MAEYHLGIIRNGEVVDTIPDIDDYNLVGPVSQSAICQDIERIIDQDKRNRRAETLGKGQGGGDD